MKLTPLQKEKKNKMLQEEKKSQPKPIKKPVAAPAPTSKPKGIGYGDISTKPLI